MSKLKENRIKKGFSQSKLADASGVNVRMIQFYEQGVRDIDGAKIETLLSLAAALECSISDILENPDLANRLKKAKV